MKACPSKLILAREVIMHEQKCSETEVRQVLPCVQESGSGTAKLRRTDSEQDPATKKRWRLAFADQWSTSKKAEPAAAEQCRHSQNWSALTRNRTQVHLVLCPACSVPVCGAGHLPIL